MTSHKKLLKSLTLAQKEEFKEEKNFYVLHGNFDLYEMYGKKIMIPIPILISCGMNMFNEDECGIKPMMVVTEIEFDFGGMQ